MKRPSGDSRTPPHAGSCSAPDHVTFPHTDARPWWWPSSTPTTADFLSADETESWGGGLGCDMEERPPFPRLPISSSPLSMRLFFYMYFFHVCASIIDLHVLLSMSISMRKMSVILLTGEEIYMYFFHVCASIIESLLGLICFIFTYYLNVWSINIVFSCVHVKLWLLFWLAYIYKS